VHVTGFTSSRQADGTRRIGSVLPASAAADAGVRVGDVLIEINGASPGTFTDAAWNSLVTGAELLRLVLRRGGAEVRVELRARPVGF
jgi:S1-C subfamily serine protease